MSVDCVISLSEHPNIIGIKDLFDEERMKNIVEGTKGNNFSVMNAYGGTFLPALKNGAVGTISAVATVLPDAVVQLHQVKRFRVLIE